jgi:hypothetical protein
MIYEELDRSGLEGEDQLQVLVNVVTRVLCQQSPDQKTAEEWLGKFSIVADAIFKEMADMGDPSWTRMRAH